MTRLLASLLLASSTLTGSSAHASGDPARPADAVVLEFPGATTGPPDRTCAEDRARSDAAKRGAEYVAPPAIEVPSKPPRVTQPDPDYAAMKQLVLSGTNLTLAQLPGAEPEALPLQTIEGDADTLATIAAVMKKAATGERVRLSFYGASHTSADWWTGEVRRVLQDRHGDLGHGFVFPAALYKGYRGQDINLCRTDAWKSEWVGKRSGRDDGFFGPGGASLSSSDPEDFGWIQTTNTNPHGRRITHLEIFSLAHPGGGGMKITVDDQEPVVVETKRDEVSLLRHKVIVPEGPHRIEIRPAGTGELRLLGVSAEREGPGVLVDAIGIRGREARSWLDWDDRLFGPGLAALDPDLVVLAYGTNEANDLNYDVERYEADLTGVLEKLHGAVPGAACLLVGPSDRGKKLGRDVYAIWDRTRPFAEAQRKVALAHGCGFWDWQQATGGEGSMVAWSLLEPRMGAKDLIHFTAAGYRWSGRRLVDALDAVAAGQP